MRKLVRGSVFSLVIVIVGLVVMGNSCEDQGYNYGRVSGVDMPDPTPVPIVWETEPNDYAIQVCRTSNSLGMITRGGILEGRGSISRFDSSDRDRTDYDSWLFTTGPEAIHVDIDVMWSQQNDPLDLELWKSESLANCSRITLITKEDSTGYGKEDLPADLRANTLYHLVIVPTYNDYYGVSPSYPLSYSIRITGPDAIVQFAD